MSQLTLELEPGLAARHKSLLECLAARIYQKGLGIVAIDLDKAPGNLSRELAGGPDRHFSVESLELYIQKHNDLTPILYLIARYMGDQATAEAATMRRLEDLMAEVRAAVGQVQAKKSTRR